jgi:hypothetical protein
VVAKKSKGGGLLMASKRYVRFPMWVETLENFKKKKNIMQKDLRDIGIKKRIPLTRLFHYASKQPIIFEDITQLKKLSKDEVIRI